MSYLNWATHAVLSMIAFSVPCLSVDAQEVGGALQKVKGSASITIGHRELSPPFSYLDENKKPVG